MYFGFDLFIFCGTKIDDILGYQIFLIARTSTSYIFLGVTSNHPGGVFADDLSSFLKTFYAYSALSLPLRFSFVCDSLFIYLFIWFLYNFLGVERGCYFHLAFLSFLLVSHQIYVGLFLCCLCLSLYLLIVCLFVQARARACVYV